MVSKDNQNLLDILSSVSTDTGIYLFMSFFTLKFNQSIYTMNGLPDISLSGWKDINTEYLKPNQIILILCKITAKIIVYSFNQIFAHSFKVCILRDVIYPSTLSPKNIETKT